jgi:hypothetical protein
MLLHVIVSFALAWFRTRSVGLLHERKPSRAGVIRDYAVTNQWSAQVPSGIAESTFYWRRETLCRQKK